MSKILKTLPPSEDGPGMTIITASGAEFRISQNREKRRHTLWRRQNGGYVKVASAGSPLDLKKYYEEE